MRWKLAHHEIRHVSRFAIRRHKGYACIIRILMSSIESLVRRLSGAHYRCISSISHELPVLSVGRDCCILNSVGSFHSLLTVVRALSIPHTFIQAGT